MLTSFNGNLACSLDFGHYLVIVAKTIDGAKRFQLNLRTGKEKTSNIGLQISPNFNEDIIIRNSKINDEWHSEEKFENLYYDTPSNPIIPGDFFNISIIVGENQFHISINNRPYCTFKFRIPINAIRNIELRDYIQTIKQIDHRKIYPFAWPPVQSINPNVGFSHDYPIHFAPGHIIIITARCFGNPKGSFTIKFFENETQRQLLHFNPRFESHIVARNSMTTNLEFIQEERNGGFPFVFDEQFKLAISFTDKQFLFAVNGKKFATFNYKTPNLLNNLVGFKITLLSGMNIHVTETDYYQMPDGNCDGFELLSKI